MSKWILPLAVGMAVTSGLVPAAEPITMSQQPFYLGDGQGVRGQLVLAPLVDSANRKAFVHDGEYSGDVPFTGYFDTKKCYLYHFDERESERHFRPVRTVQDRYCEADGEWSGNFLNWVAAKTGDIYRQTLTGGYRVRDDVNETWLQPSFFADEGDEGDEGDGGPRKIRGTDVVEGATPFKTELGYPVSEVTIVANGREPSIIVMPGTPTGGSEIVIRITILMTIPTQMVKMEQPIIHTECLSG